MHSAQKVSYLPFVRRAIFPQGNSVRDRLSHSAEDCLICLLADDRTENDSLLYILQLSHAYIVSSIKVIYWARGKVALNCLLRKDSTESELPPHPRESILSFIPFPPHSSTQKFGQQQRDKAFCRWNLSQRRKLWISLDYGNRHRWVRIFDQNNPESQEKWNMFEKLTCIQFVQ